MTQNNEENVTIQFEKKLFSRRNQDDPLTEGYVYKLDFEDYNKPVDVVCIPNFHTKETESTYIPGWCRKEVKRDKIMWRKVHKIFKATPLYAPEYFAPLPVVESHHDTPANSNESIHSE